MSHEISNDESRRMADVFSLLEALHSAEAKARIATVKDDTLTKEWTVVREVGKEILRRRWMVHIQEKYPFSEEELIIMWSEFTEKGFIASQAILTDLGINSPDNITTDYLVQHNEDSIAALGISTDGLHTLYLYPNSLVLFFLRYIFAKNKQNKTFIVKKFEAVLAHEFYHIFQHQRFSPVMKKEKEKNYWDRRYEYGARLYSLRWLRKQVPKDNAERIGLWLARADVLITQVSNQTHVRNEIHGIFGVKKPNMIQHMKMIFTNEKQ